MRLFFLLMPLCLCFSSAQAFENHILTYKTSVEGVETKTDWLVEQPSEKIEINGQNKGSDIKVEYSPSFSLLHYTEIQDGQNLFDIIKEGNQLLVKSKTSALKKLKLGTLPWIQEFKFGLQPFLSSAKNEFAFCIVYAKDHSLHDMVATKEKEEILTIEGQHYETQKLKITLKGFKSRFWKAEAWFDKKTHFLVKYKANEGPRTPYTEVILSEKKIKESL